MRVQVNTEHEEPRSGRWPSDEVRDAVLALFPLTARWKPGDLDPVCAECANEWCSAIADGAPETDAIEYACFVPCATR